MLSINTNLSSLIAQNSMKTSTDKLNQAIERMTTGFKINHAKDNAANYSISTDMTTKIGAYQVAEDNCAQGLDMVSTVSESLSLIQDKLERLRALATQASNGTYGAQSLKAINAEANALVDEIERQYNTTEYNGINLAKGKVISTEESKFIKDIDRRDTSKMTTLASVAIDEALTSGTYSISTADELAKLATMTNNGLIGASTEFVLANDIDLSGYSNWTPIGDVGSSGDWYDYFCAIFDGNGYVISNLKINSSKERQGLFGIICKATVLNLAIEGVNITSSAHSVGGLAGGAAETLVKNCYVIAENIKGAAYTGGLVGNCSRTTIEDCYSDSNITNTSWGSGGGLIGVMGTYSWGKIINSYSTGNLVCAAGSKGTILGGASKPGISIEGCYSTISGDVIGSGVVNVEKITISPIGSIKNNAQVKCHDKLINLQIGTNSDANSQINTNIGYILDKLEAFRNIGICEIDYVSLIDSVMSSLSSKQAEYGAVQNRLESALDEISIKYENLVSSRSTLRDADIAKVSSTYIQQQILQQASATLMATANQSPAIALQLI